MEPHLAVNEKNSLLEVRPQRAKQTFAVRVVARVISYVFHPLFIPVYLCWLIVKTQSYLFGSFTDWEKTIFVTRFGVMYIFFPLVSVLLMKALKFISSIQLKRRETGSSLT